MSEEVEDVADEGVVGDAVVGDGCGDVCFLEEMVERRISIFFLIGWSVFQSVPVLCDLALVSALWYKGIQVVTGECFGGSAYVGDRISINLLAPGVSFMGLGVVDQNMNIRANGGDVHQGMRVYGLLTKPHIDFKGSVGSLRISAA